MATIKTIVLIGALLGLAWSARVNMDVEDVAMELEHEQDQSDLDLDEKKADADDNASIYISFNKTIAGPRPNDVGMLVVKFGSPAYITNMGFAEEAPPAWTPGTILGKSDNFAWPLEPVEGPVQPTGPFVSSFPFDHGVSDLVLGDERSAESMYFRPEFEEIVYARMSGHGGKYASSPEAALKKTLREEERESRLILGRWESDGYFRSARQGFPYIPRLRLRESGTGFQQIGHGSFSKATLKRPSILDIDNLFSMKAAVPSTLRSSQDVNEDRMYFGRPGFRPGCKHDQGLITLIGGLFDKDCKADGERCATQEECRGLRGRWKNKYCGGGPTCGCCKEIGQHSLLEDAPQTSFAEDGMGEVMPVDFSVKWVTPVLQKFACVAVSPQYAKVGGSSMFVAMGWDTESDVSGLDLDLSLVPLDGKKKVIGHKLVSYANKRPPALRCHHGDYGMMAFNDDTSGDDPGDDELVKVNLACLTHEHPDIEAVVVTVNIYSPSRLTWSEIDSAYLRIISGGREMSKHGNFFIHDAEAVRSFVRLSGNDLKASPDLSQNGLAVGMFFKQSNGIWAFSALMEGMPGRSAKQSVPALMGKLQHLVYPANDQWSNTQEQQNAMNSGAFGSAGLISSGTGQGLEGVIGNGRLPCIATKADMAKIMLGHMTEQGLNQVVNNGKVPDAVRDTAKDMISNPQKADQIRQIAEGVEQMEQATTDQGRADIAKNLTKVEVKEPTEEDNTEALTDLDSLFDDI